MEPFIGEIRPFGFGYAPRGWLPCDGGLYPINGVYTQLFSVVGNRYGGDARTTFATPNLTDATVPIGKGQGDGLSLRQLGERGGQPYVKLLVDHVPAHKHAMKATVETADVSAPSVNTALARSTGTDAYTDWDAGNAVHLVETTIGESQGDGAAHNNLMPFQALLYCICYDGVYPPHD